MKINPISFGKTYCHKSIITLPSEKFDKLGMTIAVGDMYPSNDVYISMDSKGDINAKVTSVNLWDYLYESGELDFLSEEQCDMLELTESMNDVFCEVHNKKNPVLNRIIGNIKETTEDIIAAELINTIDDYNKKYIKDFTN